MRVALHWDAEACEKWTKIAVSTAVEACEPWKVLRHEAPAAQEVWEVFRHQLLPIAKRTNPAGATALAAQAPAAQEVWEVFRRRQLLLPIAKSTNRPGAAALAEVFTTEVFTTKVFKNQAAARAFRKAAPTKRARAAVTENQRAYRACRRNQQHHHQAVLAMLAARGEDPQRNQRAVRIS